MVWALGYELAPRGPYKDFQVIQATFLKVWCRHELPVEARDETYFICGISILVYGFQMFPRL